MEYLYQRFLQPEDWKSEICDIPRKDSVRWISELLRSNGLTPKVQPYTFNQTVYHATASKAYFTKERLDIVMRDIKSVEKKIKKHAIAKSAGTYDAT